VREGVRVLSRESEGTADSFDPEAFGSLAELEARSPWFNRRNELLIWALRRHAPQARTLLEVGCGTGFVLRALRQALPELRVAGAELHLEGLRHARERLPGVELYQLDATRSPFEAEFDVACAFDVLEHVDDDRAVLRGLCGCVRRRGTVIVTVPQHRALWSRADEYARHRRRYARAELVDKAGGVGLEVEHVTSFVTAALPLMVVSRLIERVRRAPFDPAAEHHAAERAAPVLDRLFALDLALVRRRVSLPVGGSLLLVARRPDAAPS
jgi:SAM-dependent methyltransferase